MEFVVHGNVFDAQAIESGILINPTLPENFDCLPNDDQDLTHKKWWHVPFIRTTTFVPTTSMRGTTPSTSSGSDDSALDRWIAAWPDGTRYEVRCLDGGAWDRSSSWGMFATLDAAIECAKTKPLSAPAVVWHSLGDFLKG